MSREFGSTTLGESADTKRASCVGEDEAAGEPGVGE